MQHCNSAFCLLHFAFCILSSAFCLLHFAFSLHSLGLLEQLRRAGPVGWFGAWVRVADHAVGIEKEIAAGRFRGDLYYRLSGIPLHIPPLRERPTEIEPLARHFLSAFCTRSRTKSAPRSLGSREVSNSL